jgi:hypothetical protein
MPGVVRCRRLAPRGPGICHAALAVSGGSRWTVARSESAALSRRPDPRSHSRIPRTGRREIFTCRQLRWMLRPKLPRFGIRTRVTCYARESTERSERMARPRTCGLHVEYLRSRATRPGSGSSTPCRYRAQKGDRRWAQGEGDPDGPKTGGSKPVAKGFWRLDQEWFNEVANAVTQLNLAEREGFEPSVAL